MRKLIFSVACALLIGVPTAYSQSLGSMVSSATSLTPAPRPVANTAASSDVLRNRSGSFKDAVRRAGPSSVVAREGTFAIQKGEPIHEALMRWAEKSGWELYWYPSKGWESLGYADFTDQGEVTAAVAEVVNILRDEEGKPIRLHISGNYIMEVFSTEVRYGND